MAGQKITRAGRGKRFPGAETWEKMPRWLRLTIMWSAGFAALAVIFLLLAIASPVCLAVGMITLEQPWAAWDVNEVAPTVAYLLILAAVVIPFEFARQIHRRRRVIRDHQYY